MYHFSNLARRGAIASFSSLVAILIQACGGPLEDKSPDDQEASTERALLGPINFSTDPNKQCSSSEQSYIRNAARVGRIIAVSNAYQVCVAQAMRNGVNVSDDNFVVSYIGNKNTLGPYKSCTENGNSDPVYIDQYDHVNPVMAGEVEHVLLETQSPNSLTIGCDSRISSGAAAQAGIVEEGSNPEVFDFQENNLQTTIRNGQQSFVAGTIWHEAMHQHAYHHATGQATACGYSNDPDDDAKWFTRHTVPYIVGNCMMYILDKSNQTCPATGVTCRDPANELVLVRGPATTNWCECVRDPDAGPEPPPPPPSQAPTCRTDVLCDDQVDVWCNPMNLEIDLQRLQGGSWVTVSQATDPAAPHLTDHQGYAVSSATYRVCAVNAGGMTCTSPIPVTLPHQACSYGSPGGGGPTCGTRGQPPCPQ